MPPITKSYPVLSDSVFSPEAMLAMGRIESACVDVETGLIAYTCCYHSISENRSTRWIRILSSDSVLVDEFVGDSPSWLGGGGTIAFLRGGQLYLRRDGVETAVEGAGETEGFLFSPKRDKVVLVRSVKTVASTADRYPDLPFASGRVVDKKLRELAEQLMRKGVTLTVSDSARKLIEDHGISQLFGAREVERVIRNEVKPLFVDELLFGRLRNGGSLQLDTRDGTLIVRTGEACV